MLFNITLFVDLIAMATTLWGAFYLFARGFPSWLTLRAVMVLLALSIFFFGAYNNLFNQVIGTASLRAVLLILGLETWYSLTYQLMPEPGRVQLRWMQIVVYLLGGVTAIMLLTTPDAFIEEQGNAVYVAHMRLGFPYLLYGAFQVVIVLGILYNLLTGERIGLTRQGKYFLVASAFPAFAIIGGIVGLGITPHMPRLVPDLFIFSGVFLLGISVARHQTMIERRTTIQDLPISALVVLGLAILYAYFALQWNLPLEKLSAVVAFAVLTHSVYDLAREFLERQRIRHESTFRRQLRQLENLSPSEESLQIRLQEGMDLLCDTLDSAGGFIAIRRGENFVVIATKDSVATNSEFHPTFVDCEDISHPRSDRLPDIAWMAPAFEGQTQVAVIAIHQPNARLDYSASDLDLLAEVADQVGTIISLNNLTAGRADQIQQLVTESQIHANELNSITGEMIAAISTSSDVEFVRTVEEGLRHLSDYIALGQLPLASQMNITGESHIECGKQLNKLLIDSIESLRPAEKRPPEPLPRVWYSYAVLHDAYVEGVPNREIMARLYISEGTFNRTRRNALRGLARMLIEKKN
jgi:GAF domain